MLVLTRRLGEKVVVTVPGVGECVITVVDIDRGKIRLGIDAPKDWPVHRQELLLAPRGPRAGEEPGEEGAG